MQLCEVCLLDVGKLHVISCHGVGREIGNGPRAQSRAFLLRCRLLVSSFDLSRHYLEQSSLNANGCWPDTASKRPASSNRYEQALDSTKAPRYEGITLRFPGSFEACKQSMPAC